MKKIYLIVDNIRSLYNVGAIFRLADAANVEEIYLCGISGTETFGNKVFLHPKLKKTALTGFDSVKWQYFDTTKEAIKDLKDKGVKVVGIELTPQSKNYTEVKYQLPLALLVGHETTGVTDEILEMTDETVQIPMRGEGQSLNVATSLAIVLFEVVRQIKD